MKSSAYLLWGTEEPEHEWQWGDSRSEWPYRAKWKGETLRQLVRWWQGVLEWALRWGILSRRQNWGTRGVWRLAERKESKVSLMGTGMNSNVHQGETKGSENDELNDVNMTFEWSHEMLAVQTPGLKIQICRSLGVAEAINMEWRCPRQESKKLYQGWVEAKGPTGKLQVEHQWHGRGVSRAGEPGSEGTHGLRLRKLEGTDRHLEHMGATGEGVPKWRLICLELNLWKRNSIKIPPRFLLSFFWVELDKIIKYIWKNK